MVLRAETEGVPRYTQLFLASLVLNLLGNGVSDILTAIELVPPHTPSWTADILEGSVYIAAAAAPALAYTFRRRAADSLTLAFNFSLLVYLLAYGTANLLEEVLILTRGHYPATDLGIGDWLFGPVHIVPATVASQPTPKPESRPF